MKTFWLHLRNSTIRWTLPALIAVDLAVLFLRTRYWVGIWPEAGAAAQVPTYLLAPIVAGAAAWAAAAPVRHGVTEQLGAARIHPAVSEAYRLLATFTILIAPYLIGQAVAFTLTARTFPPGVILWVGYVGLGAFVVLFAVTFGWLIGKLFTSIFATMVAAFGMLLLTAFISRVNQFIVVSGGPELTVYPAGLAWRLGLIAILSVTLVWLPISGRTRPHVALTPWFLLMALTATLVTTMPTAYRQHPGSNVRCVIGARTSLCIWPEHAKYLPSLEGMAARIDLLPNAFILPSRINESGTEANFRPPERHGNSYSYAADNSPTFTVVEGSPWSSAGDISRVVAEATFTYTDTENCHWERLTGAEQARGEVLRSWLEGYLVGGGNPDYHTSAPSAIQEAAAAGRTVLTATSRAQQFSWAEREVRFFRGRFCQN